ncbi:YceD family protein [Moraxella sp. FZFQ2102]|uniref:YceD family protein n=1 Tax=Moraxella sp. FZFQ2102 TaxID=2953752 RepID=UPI00209C0DBB|nr:YceD family protein [Moraxella sp. FZFQ2102]USZ14169.1 YceD family protein [Moraxella sp. FZFQ2102]
MTQTHKHPEHQTLPNNILLEKWADIGFHWQGEIAISEMPRLSEQTVGAGALSVVADLQKTDGVLWLNYTVTGAVDVGCQRCLEPMSFDLSGAYRLALLQSEDEIAKTDGEEFVLIDELGESARRLLPIKELLEDELMLALPLSPRHDDCDLLIESVGDEIEEEESENPFAALAALKGKFS